MSTEVGRGYITVETRFDMDRIRRAAAMAAGRLSQQVNTHVDRDLGARLGGTLGRVFGRAFGGAERTISTHTRRIGNRIDRDSHGWGRGIGHQLLEGIGGVISLLPARLESIFTRTGPIIGTALVAGLAAALAVGLPAIGAMISGALFASLGFGAAIAAAIVGAAHDPRVSKAAQRLKDKFMSKIVDDPRVQNLGQVLANQLDKVSAALDRWAPHIQNILNAGGKFLGPLTDGLIGMFDAILPSLDKLMNSKFMEDLMKISSSGLVKLGEALAGIMDKFLKNPKAMEGAKEGLQALFDVLVWGINQFGNFLIKMSEFWADLNKKGADGKSTLDHIRDAFTNIGHAIQVFWGIAHPILDDLFKVLRDVWNFWNALFHGDWSRMGHSFISMWKNVGKLLWDVLQGLWDIVIKAFGQLGIAIWTKLQEIWRLWLGWWTNIQNWWDNALNWIKGVWNTAWGWVKARAAAIWGSIYNAFSSWINNIQGYWNNFINFFKTGWNNSWNWVKQRAQDIWNNIATFFRNIWNNIWSTITGIVNRIVGWLIGRWEAIRARVAAVWNGIAGFFITVWNKIWGWISGMVNRIVGWLAGRWEAIRALIARVWNGIVGFFGNAWSRIWGWISGWLNRIVGWLAGRWEAIRKTIASVWNGIVGFFGGIWKNIAAHAARGINWVVDIINKGIGLVQKALDFLKIPWKIPTLGHVPVPGAAQGGTGQGIASLAQNKARKNRASGGRMYGPGSTTSDSIPVNLSKDEYVIRASSAKKIGYARLDQLNKQGKLGGFGYAGGGRVGANNNALLEHHRNHVHVAMGGPRMSYPQIIAAARASHIPYRVGSTYRPGSRGEGGGLDHHSEGRAVDFMGYNQDRLAGYFEHLANVIELIHRTDARDYAIFGGKGGGGGFLAGIMQWVGKGWNWVMNKVQGAGNKALDLFPTGGLPQLGKGWMKGTIAGVIKKVKVDFDEAKAAMDAGGNYGGGGAEQWRGTAMQALKMLGLPMSWLGPLLRLIGRESGGNPRAINRTDSNARAGIPSQGLMQTIPPTFNRYHYPGRNNILAPLDNILAGLRYIKSRYGSIFNVQQAVGSTPHGYFAGGRIFDGGGIWQPGTAGFNLSGGQEMVLSPSLTQKVLNGESGDGSWDVEVNIGADFYEAVVKKKDKEMARKVRIGRRR